MKAIIYKTNKIISVINNVIDYTDTYIKGDQHIEGLSSDIQVMFVSDETEIIFDEDKRKDDKKNTAISTLVDIKPESDTKKQQEQKNSDNRQFLDSSDWKIIRHLGQKAMGIQTSMSEEEYLQLEKERQSIREVIT